MKVNLGCYDKKIHGYVNVDTRPEVDPDRVDDHMLRTFEDNSIDLLYVCHMLEHLPAREVDETLRQWFDKLKPEGVLKIAVPDLHKLCSLFLLTGDIELVRTGFWGSQKHRHDYHYTGWDFNTLANKLAEIGFKAIHTYDWRDSSTSHIDDYSQSYWPAKRIKYRAGVPEVEEGCVNLSLNVMCEKPKQVFRSGCEVVYTSPDTKFGKHEVVACTEEAKETAKKIVKDVQERDERLKNNKALKEMFGDDE